MDHFRLERFLEFCQSATAPRWCEDVRHQMVPLIRTFVERIGGYDWLLCPYNGHVRMFRAVATYQAGERMESLPNVTLQCFVHYITLFQDLIVLLYFQVMDDFKLRLAMPKRRRRPLTMRKAKKQKKETLRPPFTTDDFSRNPTQMLEQLRPDRDLNPLVIQADVLPIPEQRRPVYFMELNYMLHGVNTHEGSPLLRDWHAEVRGVAVAMTPEEAAAPVL